MMTDPSSRAPH